MGGVAESTMQEERRSARTEVWVFACMWCVLRRCECACVDCGGRCREGGGNGRRVNAARREKVRGKCGCEAAGGLRWEAEGGRCEAAASGEGRSGGTGVGGKGRSSMASEGGCTHRSKLQVGEFGKDPLWQ